MSIHSTLRASSSAGLSEDQIRRIAPSVFAETAHESRSEKFVTIPTIDVLRGLQAEGFIVTQVSQSRTRDVSKREFTKHMLRMRHIGDAGKKLQVGDTFGEVILKNANDGSSRYSLMAGLFRLACSNGMTICDTNFADIRVKHMGDVANDVIEGTYTVLGEIERKMAVVEDWSNITLSREEQMAMAEAARRIRFGDAEGNVKTPIPALEFLRARRTADMGNSLWKTANIIQEAAVKGNLHGYDRAKQRRVTSKAITGIEGDIDLNQRLWMLFESMAALKKGQAFAA